MTDDTFSKRVVYQNLQACYTVTAWVAQCRIHADLQAVQAPEMQVWVCVVCVCVRTYNPIEEDAAMLEVALHLQGMMS